MTGLQILLIIVIVWHIIGLLAMAPHVGAVGTKSDDDQIIDELTYQELESLFGFCIKLTFFLPLLSFGLSSMAAFRIARDHIKNLIRKEK